MPTAEPISRDPALEVQAFWFRFRKEILAAIVILILGAVGWGSYRLHLVRQESAAATQLAFIGQPVDLATRTRDNVARVELQ